MSTAALAAGTRADRLAERLAEAELDALLVTSIVNVRYLTGFTGTSGACLVGREGERLFITDFRYVDQAAAEVRGFECLRGERDLLKELAARLSGRVGFEDRHVSVHRHGRLREAAGEGVELVPAGPLVEELRAVKDPAELEAIGEAAALSDSIYEYVRERGLAGRTEREVALDLEHEMRLRGAEAPAFPSIVASGAHAALPHATPRDAEIPASTLVIVDLGCVVDGYCSDCTRTFATGALDGERAGAYELVRSAQERAVEAARPGAGLREVDAVARDAIAAAGHGEAFGHGLGHGVGLEVHEEPRLAQTAPEDGRLEPGNVVTIEPGVYLPGRLGVRIEDLVSITPDGPTRLTTFPTTLVTV